MAVRGSIFERVAQAGATRVSETSQRGLVVAVSSLPLG